MRRETSAPGVNPHPRTLQLWRKWGFVGWGSFSPCPASSVMPRISRGPQERAGEGDIEYSSVSRETSQWSRYGESTLGCPRIGRHRVCSMFQASSASVRDPCDQCTKGQAWRGVFHVKQVSGEMYLSAVTESPEIDELTSRKT